MAIMTGTPGDDTLPGTSHADTLYGDTGNDLLKGMSGNDTLWGAQGRDDLHGGNGNDILNGEDDDDKLFGDAGNDVLKGGGGGDWLKGGDGDDILLGGAGRDTLYGGTGSDVFVFTAATDSLSGAADMITDFVHGIDKIDLSALGYTGFTAGRASETQLRLTYSAASDRTYLRDDHSDFEIALKGDYRGTLTNDDFHFAPVQPRVGYYQAAEWAQKYLPGYTVPITNLGYDAVHLDTLTGASLAGLDAIFLLNGDNEFYNPELLAAQPTLADYVFHGGVMIIHDRFVDDAEKLLPGLTGERIKRNLGPSREEVNFVRDDGTIAHGPGGDLDDASLDGGNGSNHGFAFDATLPDDVVRVLTADDPERVVGFAYSYGAGAVYYSSIPLDFYLTPLTPQPLGELMEHYAENVISWAVDGHHDLLTL